MTKQLLIFGVLAITLLAVPQQIQGSEEEPFENVVYTTADQANPNEVIHLKGARPSDWCQFGYRAYPYGYWPKERSSDFFAARKRGYMGIEIPDFITNQDGTQQGGSAGGPKPRYFKNG